MKSTLITFVNKFILIIIMGINPSIAKMLLIIGGIFGIIQGFMTMIGGIVAVNDSNKNVIIKNDHRLMFKDHVTHNSH